MFSSPFRTQFFGFSGRLVERHLSLIFFKNMMLQ